MHVQICAADLATLTWMVRPGVGVKGMFEVQLVGKALFSRSGVEDGRMGCHCTL